MSGHEYDVVVVGGGMGGLNLGALLAHAGKRVLVLERGGADALGGRAASGRLEGAAVDNGIKGLIMMGAQDAIHRRIGKPLPANVCEWTNSGRIHVGGRWRDLDAMIHASMEAFLAVYKHTATALSDEAIEALNDVPLDRFVAERTDDPNIVDFFRYLGWLFGGTLPDGSDYSAGALFYSIRRQVEANGHLPSQSYWVKGGSGAIARGLIESIGENGGEIRTGAAVSRVVIENGAVRGVLVEEGRRAVPTQLPDTRFIAAPVVVSAVAIWDIFTIVSEDDLPPWYARRLADLHRRTLNVATLTVALDRDDLWDHSGQRWVERGPATGRPWCASSLRFCDADGRYEVSFWMQLGWWEKPDVFALRKASHKAALEQLFDAWRADIEALFPGLLAAALWTLRSFGPATLIETPGNVGSALVDVQAEGVRGLYLVGERTSAAKVMGVYGSAQAALCASERILRHYPAPAAAGEPLPGAAAG